MSHEYDLVGQLVKRSVEVGEGWDEQKLLIVAAERIVWQQGEIVRLSLALDECQILVSKTPS